MDPVSIFIARNQHGFEDEKEIEGQCGPGHDDADCAYGPNDAGMVTEIED